MTTSDNKYIKLAQGDYMPKSNTTPCGKEDVYTIIQTPAGRDLLTTSICGITYPNKLYKIKRDSSTCMCIEYVESGEGVICADGKRFFPSAGDTYMLHVGENQHYWSDTDNPWKKYWINLRGPGAKKFCEIYKLAKHHHFPCLDIKDELVEIIEIAKSSDCDRTLEIIELLNKIFFKMYSHIQSSVTLSIGEQIKDYIDLHISEPLSLQDICEKFGKSESQIIRTFKTEFNTTPYAYHLDKRIELSKNLLLSSRLLIREIADNLNFYDEYYFSSIFLKKVGVTPSQYRKNSKQ